MVCTIYLLLLKQGVLFDYSKNIVYNESISTCAPIKLKGTNKAMANISKQDLDQIQLIDEKLSNAILLRADTIDSKKHLINDMIEELLDERLRVSKNV